MFPVWIRLFYDLSIVTIIPVKLKKGFSMNNPMSNGASLFGQLNYTKYDLFGQTKQKKSFRGFLFTASKVGYIAAGVFHLLRKRHLCTDAILAAIKSAISNRMCYLQRFSAVKNVRHIKQKSSVLKYCFDNSTKNVHTSAKCPTSFISCRNFCWNIQCNVSRNMFRGELHGPLLLSGRVKGKGGRPIAAQRLKGVPSLSRESEWVFLVRAMSSKRSNRCSWRLYKSSFSCIGNSAENGVSFTSALNYLWIPLDKGLTIIIIFSKGNCNWVLRDRDKIVSDSTIFCFVFYSKYFAYKFHLQETYIWF